VTHQVLRALPGARTWVPCAGSVELGQVEQVSDNPISATIASEPRVDGSLGPKPGTCSVRASVFAASRKDPSRLIEVYGLPMQRNVKLGRLLFEYI
jgi:hypothetical protein